MESPGKQLLQSLRESKVMVACHFVARHSVALGRRRTGSVNFCRVVEKLDLNENSDL
jgi:hypothetical protein